MSLKSVDANRLEALEHITKVAYDVVHEPNDTNLVRLQNALKYLKNVEDASIKLADVVQSLWDEEVAVDRGN